MKTIKLSEASRPLAEYARELGDDIVVVNQRNRPIAAVVSLKNADREVLSLNGNLKFLKIIQQSRRDFAAGRSRSLAEVRELFGLRRRANKRMRPTARRARRG
jgi:hypothetical protein